MCDFIAECRGCTDAMIEIDYDYKCIRVSRVMYKRLAHVRFPSLVLQELAIYLHGLARVLTYKMARVIISPLLLALEAWYVKPTYR